MSRKRAFNTFKEAEGRGPYDEYPVLAADVDPQLHLSRNDRPQPFFLICEKDCVLVQLSGKGRVEFRDSSMLWTAAVPGDFIYIPARTPHRFLPDEPSTQYRYKAIVPGLEGVCWYAPNAASASARKSGIPSELPQEGYLRASTAFNEEPSAPALRLRVRTSDDRPRALPLGRDRARAAR